LEGVQPKTRRDEQEDPGAQKEAAFPLQAGFAEQVFETAIRHRLLPFDLNPRSERPRRES